MLHSIQHVCGQSVWSVSPPPPSTLFHSLQKARSCEATALYQGDGRGRGTLRCVAGACRSKRACNWSFSWSFTWSAVGRSRAVIEAAKSTLKTCLLMARLFLVVWNMSCCGGRVTSRWRLVGQHFCLTTPEWIMCFSSLWKTQCSMCHRWWVGSDTACSMLMPNTLAVLGLVGQSKRILKSPRIRSLPRRRLQLSWNSAMNSQLVTGDGGGGGGGGGRGEADGTVRRNVHGQEQWVWPE